MAMKSITVYIDMRVAVRYTIAQQEHCRAIVYRTVYIDMRVAVRYTIARQCSC